VVTAYFEAVVYVPAGTVTVSVPTRVNWTSDLTSLGLLYCSCEPDDEQSMVIPPEGIPSPSIRMVHVPDLVYFRYIVVVCPLVVVTDLYSIQE
jgi:hypothetical protein